MIEKESKFNINTSSISLPLVFISTKSLLSRLNKNSLTEHCSEQLKPSLVKLNLIISKIPNLSFTELLNQNLKLALTIGIDFTKGSSQTIDNEKSLHFYKGEQPNDYEKAIRSCGDILSLYNVNKEYPVYCFGGIPKNKSSPQHAYPLNSNYLNPSIKGIEEVIKLYKISIRNIEMSSPTLFKPFVDEIMQHVKKDLKKYHVVMLLTKGGITDLQKAIDKIIDCSYLPVSFVIIGIGDSNFKEMEVLDSDRMFLRHSENRQAIRDIVQFVLLINTKMTW